MMDTKKPKVYRCDGEDAGCTPAPHWLVETTDHVTSWASWGRAMLRATRGI